MLLVHSKTFKNRSPDKVTPNEFLEWAKEDLETNSMHSIGNGLGNIKKAIHCRIDEIIDNTHIRQCKGWDKRTDTNTKLEALRILNIKYTAVVSLLTDIRNKYEHLYKLPTYRQAQGHLDTAEMWLSLSYENYSFHKIGIVNLKTNGFGVSGGPDGLKLEQCKIDKDSNLDYLWESKKEIHEIKNGKLTIIPMDTIEWQKMAKYEAKHIIFSGTANKTQFFLTPRILTYIYKKAVKELI